MIKELVFKLGYSLGPEKCCIHLHVFVIHVVLGLREEIVPSFKQALAEMKAGRRRKVNTRQSIESTSIIKYNYVIVSVKF